MVELGVIDRSCVETASSLFNWKKRSIYKVGALPSANEDNFKNWHGLSERDIQLWKWFRNITQNNMLEPY